MKLGKIDEMICEAFNIEVHSKYYAVDWYNTIGFGIAMGNDLGSEKLREWLKVYGEAELLLKVLTFLEERFTSSAWYEVKR